jgi:2-methylcitrate dehydratase PrpD
MVDLTKKFAKFSTSVSSSKFNSNLKSYAKISILDWCAVAYAAKKEPISKIVTKLALKNKGAKESQLISSSQWVTAESAALTNGTIGHALDYDNTHFINLGHPTAVVLPVVLALSEKFNLNLDESITAYIIGVETAIRIGHILGFSHYNAGFHQTATSGAFGATAAASRIMNLSLNQTMHAFGLVSTQASGIKSQFGTMGKPFHAGMAASNAIQSTKLASLNFISVINSLECEQGFLDTHNWNGNIPDVAINDLGKNYLYTKIKYKFFACCHGLHSALEALSFIQNNNTIDLKKITMIKIETNSSWLKVCNIQKPSTGLEAKFSYALTTSMILNGINMSKPNSYNHKVCTDTVITEIRDKVIVIGNNNIPKSKTIVTIHHNNEKITKSFDLSDSINPDILYKKIIQKAETLLGKRRLDKIVSLIEKPEIKKTKNLIKILSS